MLNMIFLDQVNSDCDAFRAEWNSHPISGPSTQNRSPQVSAVSYCERIKIHIYHSIQDIRFLGQLEHGVYIDSDNDEFGGINLRDLNLYLGTHGRQRASQEDEDGDDEAWEDEDEAAGSDSDFAFSHSSSVPSQGQDPNVIRAVRGAVRHRSIRVPRIVNPFGRDEDAEDAFLRSLNRVRQDGAIPVGFGFSEFDEELDEYNPVEYIRVGKVRQMPISLSEDTWRPRIIEWVQALKGLTIVLEE